MHANLSQTRTSSKATLIANLTQYRPLIVAVAAVCTLTALTVLAVGSTGGAVSLHGAMNSFMGWFFIVFAVPKLGNLDGFAAAFAQYDIVAKRSSTYARAYPFIEIFLGLILLTGFFIDTPAANLVISVVIILITSVAIVGIVRSLRAKKDIFCACLGTAFKFPLSKVAIVENGVMLMMAIAMIGLYSAMHQVTLFQGHSSAGTHSVHGD